MPAIQNIHSRWILDSRGIPTIYCEVTIDNQGKKSFGAASVPSGASTGTYEALELRDNGQEFHGKGVSVAVENINQKINNAMHMKTFTSALEADEYLLKLDESDNKSELGANAILAVSMAIHRAFAEQYGLELWQYLRRLYFSLLPAATVFPRLMCNVINGGAHADSGLSIQEFMICPDTGSIQNDIRMASEIYQTLKIKLHKQNLSTALGDEGGFAPHISTTEHVLDILVETIQESGYDTINCQLALDCAANEFYDSSSDEYTIDGKKYNRADLSDFYSKLVEEYPLISIEDGCHEDDEIGWQLITEMLGNKVSLIGDDLFVTNPKRFAEFGVQKESANGVLIKLNQIGSVSETCKMINDAKEHNYITAVSHRSGETTDDFISDLAIAAQSEFLKLGAPARGERVAKYNRLLNILDSLDV